MYKNILKTMKINHYIKNAVVFIPLIFSMNFNNLSMIINTIVMCIAFCLISSAVYFLNDLVDIEKDKLHPIKCKRPIASGEISKTSAVFIMLILLLLSCVLSYIINIKCVLAVLSYFILNIFYSVKLKNIELIDAASIAIGFILRIVGGCCAINVIPSALVIIMTFFVSMFFTYIKRKLEIQLIKDVEKRRKAVRKFNISTIDQFIVLNAVLSIAFYFTYVLDSNTIERVGSNYLYLTVIPFTLIIFRLLFLVNTSKVADDPLHFINRDLTLKYLFVFYIITFTVVII